MSKQIFLHIGGEKTGTTTLQHFLARNAPQLKRTGFDYPSEPDIIFFGHNAHFPIAACLIDKKVEFIGEEKQSVLPFVLGELTKKLSATKHKTILSCEHFSSRLTEAGQLARLRDALPTDDIKIIYYMREPSDLALAAWSTSVRCGARNAFSADKIRPENRYYNHLETLDLWASVFGKSNLIVREYSRHHLVDGDIRSDFCSLLGIGLDDMWFDEDENQSFNLECLEVLRHVNGALPTFRESESGWRRAQTIRHLISTYVPEGESLKKLVSEEEKDLIKARFGDVSRTINERYFSGRLSSDWFPASATQQPEVAGQHRTEVDLAAVLREAIIRIAEEKIDDHGKRKRKRRIKTRLHELRGRLLQLVSGSAVNQ